MTESQSIAWLLTGDVSIRYQVHRDLLNTDKIDLRKRISQEGWGKRLLSTRKENGHWGLGFYQPKWTSSHYTLLDLKNLFIYPDILEIKQTLTLIFEKEKASDGGINPSRSLCKSDVCINGMVLNYASYFGMPENILHSVVDFILSQQLRDGGFNCHSNRKGAVHSSLHTTLSVIEGFTEYYKNGYTYRLNELQKAELESREFILQHKLFQSHSTGKIIDKKFLILSYPSRWRYDILRALDYFQYSNCSYDLRMNEAMEILLKKRKADNLWPLQAKHSGQSHFDMEKAGSASRWNTLRAIRVLKHFGIDKF